MVREQILRDSEVPVDLLHVSRAGEKNLDHSQARRIGQYGKLRRAIGGADRGGRLHAATIVNKPE